MKTYTSLFALHVTGITLLAVGCASAVTLKLWFCTCIGLMLLAGVAINLYRLQLKQGRMVQCIAECLKRGDLSQLAATPFADAKMKETAHNLSEAIQQLRRRTMDTEVKQQYYENLLQKVDTAVMVSNHSGRIEWMNQSARQLLGDINRLPDTVMGAIWNKEPVVHLPLLAAGSGTSDFAVSATLIQLQGRECRLISLKNIHQAMERTEMEAWQKLIRILTHEIMNSITPIISLAETLSERSEELPMERKASHTIRQGLQVIHRRSKGLLEFVENYRKLTRLPAPVLQAFTVQDLVDDLKRLHTHPAFRFCCPQTPIQWAADRNQMEQVFINLLKNGLEACTQTVQPEVCLEVVQTADGRLRFTITDNGEGMLPEVAERIFIPFFTTKSKGSGIGLSLCKQIVAAHKGSISVESEYEKGSRFILTFPG